MEADGYDFDFARYPLIMPQGLGVADRKCDHCGQQYVRMFWFQYLTDAGRPLGCGFMMPALDASDGLRQVMDERGLRGASNWLKIGLALRPGAMPGTRVAVRIPFHGLCSDECWQDRMSDWQKAGQLNLVNPPSSGMLFNRVVLPEPPQLVKINVTWKVEL